MDVKRENETKIAIKFFFFDDFDNTYKKFRFIWGARLESYKQILDSKSDTGAPINVDAKQTDFLPSFNLIYSLTKTQNLRLSASKTLNRPEFRELAPFEFYDFLTGTSLIGNQGQD